MGQPQYKYVEGIQHGGGGTAWNVRTNAKKLGENFIVERRMCVLDKSSADAFTMVEVMDI